MNRSVTSFLNYSSSIFFVSIDFKFTKNNRLVVVVVVVDVVVDAVVVDDVVVN